MIQTTLDEYYQFIIRIVNLANESCSLIYNETYNDERASTGKDCF
jgi:hypothetical protein